MRLNSSWIRRNACGSSTLQLNGFDTGIKTPSISIVEPRKGISGILFQGLRMNMGLGWKGKIILEICLQGTTLHWSPLQTPWIWT